MGKGKGQKEDNQEKGRAKQYGPLYKKFKISKNEKGEKGLDSNFIIHSNTKFLKCNFLVNGMVDYCIRIHRGQKDYDIIIKRQMGPDLTYRDWTHAFSGMWYNDNVIDSYMQLLYKRRDDKKATSKDPSLVVLNSKLYTALCARGYDAISDWVANVATNAADLVLMPVHLAGMKHWILVAINGAKMTVTLYCSLRIRHDGVLQTIRQFMIDDNHNKGFIAFRADDWNFSQDMQTPQQGNGDDCGMFVCWIAEHLSRGALCPRKVPASKDIRCQHAIELYLCDTFYK